MLLYHFKKASVTKSGKLVSICRHFLLFPPMSCMHERKTLGSISRLVLVHSTYRSQSAEYRGAAAAGTSPEGARSRDPGSRTPRRASSTCRGGPAGPGAGRPRGAAAAPPPRPRAPSPSEIPSLHCCTARGALLHDCTRTHSLHYLLHRLVPSPNPRAVIRKSFSRYLSTKKAPNKITVWK